MADPTPEDTAKVLAWRASLHEEHGALRAGAPSDADVASLLAEVREQARRQGQEEERAAVVRWMRSKSWLQSDADALEALPLDRPGEGR